MVGWWLGVGCGAPLVAVPGAVPVVIPPISSPDSGDSGLAPQGRLPAQAYGCPKGTAALALYSELDDLPVSLVRTPEAAVCLVLDERRGLDACDRATELPAEVFARTAVALTNAGPVVRACVERWASCAEGVDEARGLTQLTPPCRGDWTEQVAIWLHADEPALVRVRTP